MTRATFIRNGARIILAGILGIIALILGGRITQSGGCSECASSGTCNGTSVCEQFKRKA